MNETWKTYNQKHNETIKSLRTLESMLEEHEKQIVNNQIDWADVGELTHVNKSLEEIIRFLS